MFLSSFSLFLDCSSYLVPGVDNLRSVFPSYEAISFPDRGETGSLSRLVLGKEKKAWEVQQVEKTH